MVNYGGKPVTSKMTANNKSEVKAYNNQHETHHFNAVQPNVSVICSKRLILYCIDLYACRYHLDHILPFPNSYFSTVIITPISMLPIAL